MTDLSIQYNFSGGNFGVGTNGATLSAGGIGGVGIIGGAHLTAKVGLDGVVTSSQVYDVGLGLGLSGVGLVGFSTAIGDGENDITVHAGTLSATASGSDLPSLSTSEEATFANTAGVFEVNNNTGVTKDLVNGITYGDEGITSADSAIGAGFGNENGEFGSTPTSDDSSSSQSDQDWNNPTNPGDQSNTTVSDSPYSTKMDRDYGVTQSSFEAAMKAMSKMGNTDYYKTPTSVLHNPGSNKKQEVKNPDDPNAGQASSSPQGLTPDQRDALGGYGKYSSDRDNSPVSQSSSSSSSGDWSGVGRSSIDNPTNAPSYSSNTSSGGPSYGPPSVSSSYRGSGSSNHSDSGNSNSGSGKPIVMDMDGDGVELIPMANNNALFDMDADGYREMMGWIDQGDALLAYDYNEDGQVDERKEIAFVD